MPRRWTLDKFTIFFAVAVVAVFLYALVFSIKINSDWSN